MADSQTEASEDETSSRDRDRRANPLILLSQSPRCTEIIAGGRMNLTDPRELDLDSQMNVRLDSQNT
jgi:hypothetical protein